MSDTRAEALLKWPGGKRLIAPAILKLIGRRTGTYYEPFAGGAAVFFAFRPSRAILSDTNEELINCYRVVRDEPDLLISRLARMPNSSDDYYRIRAERPRGAIARAARLIYLTNLAFNGIFRTNRRGEFNVPYGRRSHREPCSTDRIRAVSSCLQNAELRVADFEAAVSEARRGDTVYLDPPYTVAHSNNGFVRYNARIFSWSDQQRLASVATALRRQGCRVIVSNADHQSIRELYEGFKVQTIARASCIAAASEFRRPITECIFHC